MVDKVPTPYKIFLKKINQFSDIQNRVPTETARKVLSWRFRMPPNKVGTILHEMYELGLIDLANHRFIWIKNKGILLEDLD